MKFTIKDKVVELNHNIKMICSDIDGTLVEDGTSVLYEGYVEEIKRLVKEGIIVVVATGRSYDSCSYIFAPVIDDVYFVCDNGATTVYKGEVINAHFIERKLALQIITDIESIEECSTYISGVEYGYCSNKEGGLFQFLQEGYGLKIRGVERLPEDLPEEDILSIGLYHPEDAEGEATRELLSKYDGHPEVDCVCAGVNWINFCKKNVNKGVAIEILMSKYGIKKEETIAFGDNMNDIQMLQTVGIGVAIGNARDEVKEAADYVADTNHNHGVWQVIKQIKG
ncbi:MAG: HAD family hydrolase [Lachnospiraceae bacterium]